jgi:hypothetical protein
MRGKPMTQAHGVLDYAPPPKHGGVGSVGKMLAMLAAFAVVGGLLGALAGRFAFGPLYASRGIVYIVPTPSRVNAPPAALPQLLPVVTTALNAARQMPAGRSLPSSPAQALSGARIVADHAQGGLIEVSYTYFDPNAAACMNREMVNAIVVNFSRSQLEVNVVEMPGPPTPVRDAWPLFGGMAGMAGGIAIFIAWVFFRARRRTGAV